METLLITPSTFYSKQKQPFINPLSEFKGKHSNHFVHNIKLLARMNKIQGHCVEAKKLF